MPYVLSGIQRVKVALFYKNNSLSFMQFLFIYYVMGH